MKHTAKKDDTRTFRHAPHVAFREVEEETVLLNTDSSEYYSLNPVASDIWSRIGEGEGVGRISSGLSADYGQPAKKIAKDTREFISSLLREGLILAVK